VPSSFKKYACPLSLVLVSEPTASVILKSDTYKTRHSDHQLGSSICVFNTRRQVQSALPWYLGATTVSTIDSNGAFLSPKDLHGRLSCVCDLEHSRVGVFLEKDGRAKGHSHPGSFVRTPTQIIGPWDLMTSLSGDHQVSRAVMNSQGAYVIQINF
jgi:hypothetical protein